jgi:hypothetical protein
MPELVVFVLIAAWFRRAFIVACPSCMRKKLLRLTLINILPGNVLWLVMLVPWYGICAALSYSKGHSSSVLKALNRG